MRIAGACVVMLLALYGLHRAMAAMEEKGWIYYRRRRGGSGAMSSAALEVQKMLEPGAAHVLQVREEKLATQPDGEDPH